MEPSSETCDKSVVEKKEIPPNMQKICLVCGDKALGYNFNVISCESCKAFFRRNALASKEFKCPFTNNCEITVVTRRFCQKCRLEKCFSVGMVKEFIMSEEDKAEKRRKIEENRAKKRHSSLPEDTVSSSKNIKLDEPPTTEYSASMSDSNIIQYNILSTTCSPQSTVHSPLSNDLDSSLQSSPAFNQSNSLYVPIHSTDQPYMKVYPIDEKAQFDQRLIDARLYEQYNNCNSVDNSISYSDPPKQNSIRSILTNGESPPVQQHSPAPETNQTPAPSETPVPPVADPAIDKAREILQDVERIEPNSMEWILCEAVKLEFAAQTSHRGNCSRELNEVERAKLNELIVANKALNAPIDNDVEQLFGDVHSAGQDGANRHDPRLITIVNITAIAIRRLIKMAKRIHAFKNMCEEDQVALLKGGCIEMMILRSTMTYDGQQNQWTLPHSAEQFGSIRTDVLKLAKGDIYRSHEAFIRSFDARWRQDERVILLLSAILLFTPDRHKVIHRDVIKLEQNSYYYLLRRYLESVYAGCEARATFLKLIQKIAELRRFAEEITGVYLDVNPLEPLLMEIFDLKQHPA